MSHFGMQETVAATLGDPLSTLLGEQLSTCRYRMLHTVLYSLEQKRFKNFFSLFLLCKHLRARLKAMYFSLTQRCPFISGSAFSDILKKLLNVYY